MPFHWKKCKVDLKFRVRGKFWAVKISDYLARWCYCIGQMYTNIKFWHVLWKYMKFRTFWCINILFLRSITLSNRRSNNSPKLPISVDLRPHAMRPLTTLPLGDHNFTMERDIDLLFSPFYSLYHVVCGAINENNIWK